MAHIASTANQDIIICEYKRSGDRNQILKELKIRGGAGVADSRSLITKEGLVTEVTDKDLEWLKKQPMFIEMCKDGYLKICGYEKAAKNAIADMEKDTGSRQITPEDYTKKGKKTPKSENIED